MPVCAPVMIGLPCPGCQTCLPDTAPIFEGITVCPFCDAVLWLVAGELEHVPEADMGALDQSMQAWAHGAGRRRVGRH
jgi:Zn-finger nucleic acid-binding protein